VPISFRHVYSSVCRSACINLAATGWFYIKFDIGRFLWNYVERIQICL